MSDVCPHCGQKMLIRHGIKLSPKLADMFDMIARRAMDAETMAWVFYPGKSMREAKRCIYVSINHINGHFASTDIRIASDTRGGLYRVLGL